MATALDFPSRLGPLPHATDGRRTFNIRLKPLLGIIAAHIAVVGLLVALPGERVRPLETEPLVTLSVRPAVLITDDPSIASAPRRPPRYLANALQVKPGNDADPPVVTAIGVGIMAPRAIEGELEPSAFARQAGLQPGKGATVVLRIEVLGSGEVGRVEIDVSGGSTDIDGAAVAYARALPWVGGMINGCPATLWVRRAVRLQL